MDGVFQKTMLEEMDSAPRISIIIPMYNVEDYLDECLDSVTTQTFRDIEILCIDDGSTDGTARMLDGWAQRDARIRVDHEPNRGVSAARNRGMDLARGEYLMFVDADDCVAPVACELLSHKAQEYGADAVVYGGKTFPTEKWADDALALEDGVYIHRGWSVPLYVAAPFMYTTMYSRRIIEEHHLRVDTDLRLGEDNAFNFAFFPYAETVVACKERFYRYRFGRPGSATEKLAFKTDSRLNEHTRLVLHIIEEWANIGCLEAHKQEIIAFAVHLLIWDFFYSSFSNRVAQSEKLSAIFDRYFSADDLAAVPPDVAWRLTFMLEAKEIPQRQPRLSVIVIPDVAASEVERCLTCYAYETMQQIEMVVPLQGVSADRRDALETFAARDCRVHLLEGSFGDALRAAQGDYLIIARLADEYDHEAFSRIVNRMDNGATNMAAQHQALTGRLEVLAFADFAGDLRCRDITDGLLFSASAPVFDLSTLRSSDISMRLFDFASLYPGNKCFDRAFLLQVANDSPYSPDNLCALVCAALQRAQTISQMADELLESELRREPDAVASSMSNAERTHGFSSSSAGKPEILLWPIRPEPCRSRRFQLGRYSP